MAGAGACSGAGAGPDAGAGADAGACSGAGTGLDAGTGTGTGAARHPASRGGAATGSRTVAPRHAAECEGIEMGPAGRGPGRTPGRAESSGASPRCSRASGARCRWSSMASKVPLKPVNPPAGVCPIPPHRDAPTRSREVAVLVSRFLTPSWRCVRPGIGARTTDGSGRPQPIRRRLRHIGAVTQGRACQRPRGVSPPPPKRSWPSAWPWPLF